MRVTQIYFVSVSHFNWTIVSVKVSYQQLAAMVVISVKPRFNEVPRDWGNVFVISRVRYIENLDITNLCKITKMFVISRYS